MRNAKLFLLGTSAVMASITGGQAFAQATSASPPAAGPESGATPGGTTVKEVVVTGSRIAHISTATPEPVEVITGQEIQDRGFTNVADIINQLPAFGAGITPIGGQNGFGTGFNYVDLFSLGSNRTLTLVDGQRFIGDNPNNIFANTGGTQVDLNALPTLFIDRVDTVYATGAAVYGSDAISGVVNVVMKQKFEGEEVSVQGGTSTYADVPRYTVEAAIGHTFLDGKLNLAADFQYDRTNALNNTDRSYLAADLGFVPNPGSGPAQIVVPNNRIGSLTAGGVPYSYYTGGPLYLPGTTTPVQFAKNGNLVAFNPGVGNGVFVEGGDGLDLAPSTSLQTPLDRKVFAGMATYDFTPHIHLHVNLNYADVNATETANQPNYSSTLFGYSPAFNQPGPGPALLISPQNAFLNAQAQGVLAANGVDSNGFYLSRANTDITPDPIVSFAHTLNVSSVLNGDFNALDRKFDWSVAFSDGIANTQFHQTNIVYGNGGTIPNLFGWALDSSISPVTGKPVCNVTLNPPPPPAGATPAQVAQWNKYISTCQPFDPFGVNNNSKSVLSYFEADFGDKARNAQDDVQANIGTRLFTLPAGDLKINLGFESRHEEASFSPSPASAEGIGYSVPIARQTGTYDTHEYYAEGFLPIFSPTFNFPFAYKLELQAAYREVFTDISHDALAVTSGNTNGDENKAWSYGVEYAPFKDITFRGSRSKTFRDPSLQELTSPPTNAYDTGTDPCQASNINAGPNPKVRAANCAKAFAALGADLSTFTSSIVQNATIPVTSGGNPNLKNEVGNSFTYGVILQPRWIPGLTATADYIQIDITNAIEYYGVGAALETCYDSPSYPSNACSLFTRAQGTGQVVTATEGYVNAGYNKFAAANYNVYYERAIERIPGVDLLPFVHPTSDLGRFSFNFNAVNVRHSLNSVSGLGFDTINSAGTIGTPRWRWNATFTYNKGPLRLGLTSHWIQSSAYDLTFTSANQLPLTIKDSLTHDVSVGYKITPALTVKLNVNNVFNTPPPSPVGTYGTGYYDFIGRYFLFGLNAKF